MTIEQTPLKDCFIIQPRVFEDERGYFFETFNKNQFKQATGVDVDFVQDNEAKSNYGVVRGLHFQTGEYAQAKLVRVVAGSVLDVVVDCRPESPTYMQHYSLVLSSSNFLQLYIPRGFAHGYSVLEDNTIFSYKCDNYYNKESEGGMYYADERLNIDWKIPKERMIISAKDEALKIQ